MEPRSKNFRTRGLGKLPSAPPKREVRARTLVRVVRAERLRIKVCLSGWNHRSYFWVPRDTFPKHYKFERGYRFHANVNLAATRPSELDFRAPFEEGSTKVPSWADLVKSGAVLIFPALGEKEEQYKDAVRENLLKD